VFSVVHVGLKLLGLPTALSYTLCKALLCMLPTNGGEMLTLIAAILLGRTLPITPVQILGVNMITAVTLALALAFEPSEGNVMKRPPRAPNTPILSGFLLWRIGFVSLIIVAGNFGLFLWERGHRSDTDKARSASPRERSSSCSVTMANFSSRAEARCLRRGTRSWC
jgi:magnesium-transporting ATPase (P-type)